MKALGLILLFLLQSVLLYAQEQEQAYALRPSIWKQKAISVCWDNPTDANKDLRDLVRQVVRDTWEKNSGLQFTDWVPVKDKNADIHIFIDDVGPHTKGLGNTLKNMPQGMVLNFTFNNWSQACRSDKEFCIKAIAVHEFGHAIGLAHEQNRKDCSFPDCLGKEQGGNGDWYVTPCDLNSIMNYCNPNWSNDGILSDLDIKAVQILYGKPQNQTSLFQGLQLVHTSNQIAPVKGKRISHEFKIYLAGSDAALQKVDKVVYHLHPTFKNSNMTNTYRENKFGLGLKVWGQFLLTADVYKTDGSKMKLSRYLDFAGLGVKPPG